MTWDQERRRGPGRPRRAGTPALRRWAGRLTRRSTRTSAWSCSPIGLPAADRYEHSMTIGVAGASAGVEGEGGRPAGHGRGVVVIPTYNERENLERLVAELLRSRPDLDVLVVDDSSPDGTGDIADALAAAEPRVGV